MVCSLDVGQPFADVPLAQPRDGGAYKSLFVLAKLDGNPFGTAVIPTEGETEIPSARVAIELRRQLHRQMTRAIGRRARRRDSHRTVTSRRSVSVVITTCCNPANLERCLTSVLASDYAEFEVIVVENRPDSPGTKEMLAERFGGDRRVHYIEERRRGLSSARNAGLAFAENEIIAFIDDDIVVDRAWMSRAAGAFERSDDIGCVTGLILPLELENESQLQLERFMALSKGFAPRIFHLPESWQEFPLLPYTPGVIGSGANTFLRTDVAERLGGFDPSLGTGTPASGGEDLDLFIRLLSEGHTIAYEPGAIVWHPHPSGTSKLRRQVYRYGVGLGATLAKQLFVGPDRRRLLRAVPGGVRYALDPSSRKNASKNQGSPRGLTWLERLGMAVGPAAYLASALLQACLALATRRAGRPDRLPRSSKLVLSGGQAVNVIEYGPVPVRRVAVRPARRRARQLSGPLERLVVSSAFAACLAAPLFVALDVAAGLRFAGALALFCLAPGAALISRLEGRAEFGLVLGASLASSVLVACSMLWLGSWEPRLFLYALSTMCLLALWPAVRRPVATSRQTLRERARYGAPSASVLQHGALLAAVADLWILSIVDTHLDRIAGLGLIDALPPGYFVAVALLVLGFARAITSDELHPGVLAAYTVALTVVLHGTTPLVYHEPRYAWVYNHFAVIDLIAKTGGVHRQVDIYNNWPGFFALNAWLSSLSGLKPSAYAPWAQVFFNLANVAALRFALRGLSRNERLLWTASWLFLLANWVGQDYLAPQALAFVLFLVVVGLCLRCGPRPREPRVRISRWLAGGCDRLQRLVLRGTSAPEPVAERPLGSGAAVVVVGVCYLAVVVSHQLTPVVLVLGAILLALIARTVHWWVAAAMAVIEGAWVALAWPYVGAHFSLLDLSPFAGTTPAGAGSSPGLPGHDLVAHAAQLAVVLMLAFAAIGVVRRTRASRWDLPPALLVIAPVVTVQLQAYGGEGRYRAYLFALPWLAFFAAAALTPGRSWRARSAFRSLPMVAVCTALGACTLFAYFGLEYMNHVTPDDVAAGVWFDQHAPPSSLFVTVTGNAISRVTARYGVASNPAYPASPALTDHPRLVGQPLDKHDLPEIEAALRGYGDPSTFLAITESQQHYARLYGLLPNDWRVNLDKALRASSAFKLVYRHGTSEIFAFNPTPARP